MKRAKKKARPAGGTARQATETGTTIQKASTSVYNDTITCRSQSIVAKASLNSRESSYQEHFCAICCSQKVFTPNFSDTHIVELYNKFVELSLIQRHNLFYSRLFFITDSAIRSSSCFWSGASPRGWFGVRTKS